MTVYEKHRIMELWLDGWTAIELARMYGVTTWRIYYINRGLKRPKRI